MQYINYEIFVVTRFTLSYSKAVQSYYPSLNYSNI